MSHESHTIELSFTVRRINQTTFVIREDDAYAQNPLIYVKLHPRAPVVILSDTGCDEPRSRQKTDGYINLRTLLETIPLATNNNQPLNPAGQRQYIIICTHCHFDHVGGITQFLDDGTTDVVASAAGRDFIETDLAHHGVFDEVGMPVPTYRVTKWATAFERIHWSPQITISPDAASASTISSKQVISSSLNPLASSDAIDVGISIIHTPGHTPDELAWYDHDEKHLYVGDSFYRRGSAGIPVLWPIEGSLIEWSFSMQKLRRFVQSENARLVDEAAAADATSGDDWVTVASRVKVSCGHETVSADAGTILHELEDFWHNVLHGDIPVVDSVTWRRELNDIWRDVDHDSSQFIFEAPRRLMDDARNFFGVTL